MNKPLSQVESYVQIVRADLCKLASEGYTGSVDYVFHLHNGGIAGSRAVHSTELKQIILQSPSQPSKNS